MDMPESLRRKLTDSSCSERLTRSEVSPALFFWSKIHQIGEKTIDKYTELVYIIITERKERRK